MPIYNPFPALEAAEIVPVWCPDCGYTGDLHRPDLPLRHALFERTILGDAEEEVALLHRAKGLFESLGLPWGDWPPADKERSPALRKALNADPELKRRLQGSHMSLPGRLAGRQQQAEEMQKRIREGNAFHAFCPACRRDVLRLERTFYAHLPSAHTIL